MINDYNQFYTSSTPDGIRLLVHQWNTAHQEHRLLTLLQLSPELLDHHDGNVGLTGACAKVDNDVTFLSLLQ